MLRDAIIEHPVKVLRLRNLTQDETILRDHVHYTLVHVYGGRSVVVAPVVPADEADLPFIVGPCASPHNEG